MTRVLYQIPISMGMTWVHGYNVGVTPDTHFHGYDMGVTAKSHVNKTQYS